MEYHLNVRASEVKGKSFLIEIVGFESSSNFNQKFKYGKKINIRAHRLQIEIIKKDRPLKLGF